jgi:hypothetical protein
VELIGCAWDICPILDLAGDSLVVIGRRHGWSVSALRVTSLATCRRDAVAGARVRRLLRTRRRRKRTPERSSEAVQPTAPHDDAQAATQPHATSRCVQPPRRSRQAVLHASLARQRSAAAQASTARLQSRASARQSDSQTTQPETAARHLLGVCEPRRRLDGALRSRSVRRFERSARSHRRSTHNAGQSRPSRPKRCRCVSRNRAALFFAKRQRAQSERCETPFQPTRRVLVRGRSRKRRPTAGRGRRRIRRDQDPRAEDRTPSPVAP